MSARLRNGSRRRRRTFGVAVIAFAASLTLDSDPGWTYKFQQPREGGSATPRSDAAGRWNPEAWGPGETLTWHVADGPRWSPHFADAREALPQVQAALDAWSSVPTADLRLRLAGVTKRATLAEDNRNLVLVGAGGGRPNYARVWLNEVGGVFQAEECDVVLVPETVAHMADEENPVGLTALIHELGHCFALGHAAVTPTLRWGVYQDVEWLISSVWEQDPVMSYGESANKLLTEDDMVGISLLRPARGWLETTGSISGRLMLDGEPAQYASVHLLRNDGGRARPSVQVFSDEAGAFLAEGLVPGDYFLWIHPLLEPSANRWLSDNGTVSDMDDLLDLRPLRVLAGQEVDAGEFALRRGREHRD